MAQYQVQTPSLVVSQAQGDYKLGAGKSCAIDLTMAWSRSLAAPMNYTFLGYSQILTGNANIVVRSFTENKIYLKNVGTTAINGTVKCKLIYAFNDLLK